MTQQYGSGYPYGQAQPQPQPYGQPPGGPPPAGPKRSKLPWILTGAGVLVAVVIAAAIFFVLPAASSSSGGATAQGAAQNLVDTINSGVSFFGDTSKLDPLLCQQSRDALKAAQDQVTQYEDVLGPNVEKIKNIKTTARLGKVTETNPSQAKAEVTLVFSNIPPELAGYGFPTETTDSIDLIKENGKWVACDLAVS